MRPPTADASQSLDRVVQKALVGIQSPDVETIDCELRLFGDHHRTPWSKDSWRAAVDLGVLTDWPVAKTTGDLYCWSC